MFDVDAALCQTEIGSVWATGIFRERAFIEGLVFERDAVAVEPAGNFPFFKASDDVAIERAKLMGFYPLEIAFLGFEVPSLLYGQ